MLPTFVYHFITTAASLSAIVFIIYYFNRLHLKEKELDERTKKIDTEYHKIVDNALSKERKILDDAATEADKIITDADYVSTSTKDSLDKALQKLVTDLERESDTAGRNIMVSYQESLKKVTGTSLENFNKISKELEDDLQKQLKTFNETQMGNIKKEIEEYKQSQLKQTEQMVTGIVQQVSQEILNKSFSVEDHQKLIVESFEKAKKDGLFE